MKITPRQVSLSDHVDQSRDISGFNKWAQSSRIIGFFLFILGWFTIPVEVFLRRDFGQRWFTAVNFYAGLFLLLIFATVQYLWGALWDKIQEFILHLWSLINPYYKEPEQPDDFFYGLMDASMLIVLIAYILMASYHLFKIWWRNRTDSALHSFDDGTSRLEPVAGFLMKILNVLAVPVVYLYILLIPPKQRKSKPVPKLINDRTAFANTVLEPVLLFYLAMKIDGMISLWLFCSSIALAIHANWKETAKLNKVLDFRDSMMEAKVMRELKNGSQRASLNQQKKNNEKDVNVSPPLIHDNPVSYAALSVIIEEMNSEKGVS